MASREAWGGGLKETAARRMKGVVKPQATPTRRKPSVQLSIEGEEGGDGSAGAGEGVDMVVGQRGNEEGGWGGIGSWIEFGGIRGRSWMTKPDW